MKPSYFWLRKYNFKYKVIYTCHDYILYKLEFIFVQRFLHYQHTFLTFEWDALWRSRKTICWSVGTLRAGYISAHHFPTKLCLRSLDSGNQNSESRKALIRDCRGDEEEQIQGADSCESNHGQHLRGQWRSLLVEFLNRAPQSIQIDVCGHWSRNNKLEGFGQTGRRIKYSSSI